MAVAVRELQRHARLAGLRGDTSFEAVERRRLQLWAVMSACLVALSLLVAVTSLWSETTTRSAVPPHVLQIGMVALSLGFSIYVFEKERALRGLTGLLVDERVLRVGLARQVGQLHELVAAGRAMTATLEVERVLDLVLDHAIGLFEAQAGSVLMMTPEGTLRMQAVRGEVSRSSETHAGEAVARRVALTREAQLMGGGGRQSGEPAAEGGMSVPLLASGRLVGVLNIHAAAGHDFSHLDLSVLEAFGEHAATAVANAMRFEQERATSHRYRDLEDVRQEFRWLAR